jgi:hypothetical protein
MRRNEKSLKLPENTLLVAATYGVGPDDYLAVILAFRSTGDHPENDEFVTWRVNLETEPVMVGEGYYMPRKGAKPFSAEELEWTLRAWQNFTERSRLLLSRIPAHFAPSMGADGKDPGEPAGRPGGASFL